MVRIPDYLVFGPGLTVLEFNPFLIQHIENHARTVDSCLSTCSSYLVWSTVKEQDGDFAWQGNPLVRNSEMCVCGISMLLKGRDAGNPSSPPWIGWVWSNSLPSRAVHSYGNIGMNRSGPHSLSIAIATDSLSIEIFMTLNSIDRTGWWNRLRIIVEWWVSLTWIIDWDRTTSYWIDA